MRKTTTASMATKRLDPKRVAASGIIISPTKMEENGTYGWTIVVADRGFVWIGDCLRQGDSLYCVAAQNIRTWGTQKGLGQLAMTGPTDQTELDPVPCVIVPMRAVIALIPAKEEPWAKYRKGR